MWKYDPEDEEWFRESLDALKSTKGPEQGEGFWECRALESFLRDFPDCDAVQVFREVWGVKAVKAEPMTYEEAAEYYAEHLESDDGEPFDEEWAYAQSINDSMFLYSPVASVWFLSSTGDFALYP